MVHGVTRIRHDLSNQTTTQQCPRWIQVHGAAPSTPQHTDATPGHQQHNSQSRNLLLKKKSIKSNGMEWLWKEFGSPTSKLLWDWGH